MHAEFRTDRGRIRNHNEDNGGIFENQLGNPLVIVADGMGGHRAGDVASEMAVRLLSEMWQNVADMKSAVEIDLWFREAIQDVNQKIVAYAKEDPTLQGMGTTLVAAIFSNSQIIVANVGDSRGYLMKNGMLEQLTEDHSLVNELLRKGENFKKRCRKSSA
ncbi:serine/threonine protein phosphatase [Listeria grandensis FSL F6-0971]|uniref:Serine/threonine protein phosphatase n=1 Tax=Listeria grandensis FSL F6-0971 TaxID=1265819 RepID=W7BNM3_9LIST|nr:serine/threonine protein phosphatase [Listeria grandensis FSL F6-0971]